MKKLLILVLLIASPFAKADWVAIKTIPNGTVVYIDDSTIKRNHNLVKLWLKMELDKPRKFSKGDALSSRVYYQYDCQDNKERVIVMTWFSGKGLTGQRMLDDTNENSEWEFVAPNTLSASILNLACKKG